MTRDALIDARRRLERIEERVERLERMVEDLRERIAALDGQLSAHRLVLTDMRTPAPEGSHRPDPGRIVRDREGKFVEFDKIGECPEWFSPKKA